MQGEDYKGKRYNFYFYSFFFSIIAFLVLIDYFQWFELPSQLDGISHSLLYDEREEIFTACCWLYIGISIGISWARGWPNSPDIQLKNKSMEFVGNSKTTIEKATQKLFVDFSEFWKTIWFIGAGIFSYLFIIDYFGVLGGVFADLQKGSFSFCLVWLTFFAVLVGSYTPEWVVSLGEWIDGLDEEE